MTPDERLWSLEEVAREHGIPMSEVDGRPRVAREDEMEPSFEGDA